MSLLDSLAERRISEAVSRGELDDLPGAGRPLDLADDALVPEELRVAYRLLKNAGFIPPEVQALNEIADLERLATRDAAATRRLSLLRARIDNRYLGKVLDRLGGRGR